MTDKQQNTDDSQGNDPLGNDSQENDPLDFELAKAVKTLNREIQPQRDLWPGIERKIVQYPQRKKTDWKRDWMPYGVAASLVMALSTLVLTFTRIDPLQTETVSFDQSMQHMQNEYRQVINPMVKQFSEVNKSLDPETLQELYRNIEILELARKDIEEQVRKNPNDPRLVEMLMWIHEQEVKLLKRDFASPIRTM